MSMKQKIEKGDLVYEPFNNILMIITEHVTIAFDDYYRCEFDYGWGVPFQADELTLISKGDFK